MPDRPKCADLFCGAGGAAMGLHRAGFDVEGWDIKPQPHYPFTFHLGNALDADLTGFDFVWASPPCQPHSALKTMPNAKHHDDLIPATREKLIAWGGPYIIENVPGSTTLSPVAMLCGTMFDLGTADGQAELRRHRYFESNIFLTSLVCRHSARMVCGVYGGHGRDRRRTIGVYGDSAGISDARKEKMRKRVVNCYGHTGGYSVRDGAQQFTTQQRREAMGIEWMNGTELSQAIPPAYSEFLGRQILKAMNYAPR